MTSWGVDLVAVAGAAAVFWGRPRVALAVLLATAVLVPTPLVVPHMHTALFTLQRVLVLVVSARVVRLAVEGRRPLRRPRDPATFALGAVIVVSFVVGVVFAVSASYDTQATFALASLFAQLGFFIACLVLVRELDSPWEAVTIAAAVMFIDVGIGIGEHVSGASWGHWWMGHLNGQNNLDASHPLAVRNGETRVKAGSEFALQFSWVTLSLLPCALALATRMRRGVYLGVAALLAAGLAVYWSYSRSALGALLPVVVLLALLARNRVLSALALATAAVGLFAYGLVPSVARHLSAGTDDVSVATRLHKLQPIFGEVARHPFRGLGLGNISGSGFHTTDNALLLVYIELGVIGVVALVLLFLSVAGQSLRAYSVALPDERVIGAACFVGVVAYIVSSQVYDAFSLLQGPQVLWFLVAVATVVAERGIQPVVIRRTRATRAFAAALAGLAMGGALLVFAPTHVGYRAVVVAEPGFRDALPYNSVNGGRYLITTACEEADAIATTEPGTSVDCRPVSQTGGVGVLYVQAPTRARLLAEKDRLVSTLRDNGGIRALKLFDLQATSTGRPTMLRTAPVWLPLMVIGLMLLPPLPSVRVRRRMPRRRLEERFAG